jgi:pSer/pThr/pTyr-binding forkhead associated (FHA) protein
MAVPSPSKSPLISPVASAGELKERLEAERRGAPFLLYRDGEGQQRIHTLGTADSRVVIGRRPDSDVSLEWDREVSRLHAELERLGADWTIADDNLSRNGSYVNGVRVSGRRRLADGDAIRVGGTAIAYCAPSRRESEATEAAAERPTVDSVSATQRQILLALCRPFREADTLATPATNKQIAEEMYLSVDAVKGHLRTLFQRFGIDHLPQNQKRTQLVWEAFQAGIVTTRDLWGEEAPR